MYSISLFKQKGLIFSFCVAHRYCSTKYEFSRTRYNINVINNFLQGMLSLNKGYQVTLSGDLSLVWWDGFYKRILTHKRLLENLSSKGNYKCPKISATPSHFRLLLEC